MIESPFVGPVVDLVDPYFTPEVKNAGGFRPTSRSSNVALWWIRQHPGRWALVGEGSTGLTRQLLKGYPDIHVKERQAHDGPDRRVYACVRHPQGESLSAALARRPISPGLYLPAVTRDEFNWSPAELAEACRVAKANLFPTGAP